MKFTQEDINELNKGFENSRPEDVLRWVLDELHPDIALATSFQASGMVLIDMLMNINPEARIFTLDTGRLNQETYDIIDVVRGKYDTDIEVQFPDKEEVEEMVKQHGMNLFYRGKYKRLLCCQIRKTNPLNKMLKGLKGWITSIRRDQTESRAETNRFEIDELHGGIIKVNPLIDWKEDEIWKYIRANNVPYNKLHDMGYPSIGCQPCTRAVKPGEDPRAGRWWWESDSEKECGIHFDHNSVNSG